VGLCRLGAWFLEWATVHLPGHHGLANPAFSCISSFVFQVDVSNSFWIDAVNLDHIRIQVIILLNL
jgi:hypothetical protein